jgi:hypothetical protein
LKKKIMSSPEWEKLNKPAPTTSAAPKNAPPMMEDEDSDVPF